MRFNANLNGIEFTSCFFTFLMWHSLLVFLQSDTGSKHFSTKEEENIPGSNFQGSTANHPYIISAQKLPEDYLPGTSD